MRSDWHWFLNGLLYSYAGSKWRLARWYQRYYVRHRIFVDLFGGTGAVTMRKEPSPVEVYNDADGDVCNVFAVLQDLDACKKLLWLLEHTPNSREQYEICRAVLTDPNQDRVRRAWAFLVCGNIGFSGHPSIKHAWIRPQWGKQSLLKLPHKIIRWRDRFRQVYLENLTWQEVIEKYDGPDTLFLADPPYLPEVLRCSKDNYYIHTMSMQDHIELIERLRRIEGRAILCGYAHPLYTESLFHWRHITFPTRAMMGGNRGDERIERIWLNYRDDGSKIEGNRIRIAGRYIDIMGGPEEAAKYLERVKRLRELPK